MSHRPLHEQAGISQKAWQMLQYLHTIARNDRAFSLQDSELNHRCNVTPDNNFTVINELFEAGKIDFDYRMLDGFEQRLVRLA